MLCGYRGDFEGALISFERLQALGSAMASSEDLQIKFADIRKRTYRIPKLGQKCKFIAIPTTSGTGSEVTAFAVITDKKKGIKYPIADYAMTPNIAIIDPELAMTMPPSVTADTGLDALTPTDRAPSPTLCCASSGRPSASRGRRSPSGPSSPGRPCPRS